MSSTQFGTRALRQVREFIQPRLDAGDSDSQILAWGRETVSTPVSRRVRENDVIREAFPGDPDAGEAIVAKLDQVTRPVVVRMRGYLDATGPGIDAGDATTRALIDWLTTTDADNPDPLTDAERDALKALGERSSERFALEGRFKSRDDASWLQWIAAARQQWVDEGGGT